MQQNEVLQRTVLVYKQILLETTKRCGNCGVLSVQISKDAVKVLLKSCFPFANSHGL